MSAMARRECAWQRAQMRGAAKRKAATLGDGLSRCWCAHANACDRSGLVDDDVDVAVAIEDGSERGSIDDAIAIQLAVGLEQANGTTSQVAIPAILVSGSVTISKLGETTLQMMDGERLARHLTLELTTTEQDVVTIASAYDC